MIVICLPTKHEGDLNNSIKCVCAFQIEWNLEMMLFELEYPAKTTLKMDPILRRRHDIKTLNFFNPQALQAWCGRFSGF